MAVMTASVHFARCFRSKGHTAYFINRQCIHVSSQANASITRRFSVYHSDNTSFAQSCVNFINTIFGELFGNNFTGSSFFKPQFRIGVQIPINGHHLVFGGGNSRKNIHGIAPKSSTKILLLPDGCSKILC